MSADYQNVFVVTYDLASGGNCSVTRDAKGTIQVAVVRAADGSVSGSAGATENHSDAVATGSCGFPVAARAVSLFPVFEGPVTGTTNSVAWTSSQSYTEVFAGATFATTISVSLSGAFTGRFLVGELSYGGSYTCTGNCASPSRSTPIVTSHVVLR